MSFLNLEDKVFVVFGVANRRSVAYRIARTLEEEGARRLRAQVYQISEIAVEEIQAGGHCPLVELVVGTLDRAGLLNLPLI